jgi:hypothetical protein
MDGKRCWDLSLIGAGISLLYSAKMVRQKPSKTMQWDCIVSSALMSGVLLIQLACSGVAFADARWVEGTYRNPAFGYSITIPPGLRGLADDKAGPERGVRISLPSGGVILVYGEPNSLHWKSPKEGLRSERANIACGYQPEVKQINFVLNAAKAVQICGDRVLRVILAFRKSGGPVYWLRLETVRAHASEDEEILDSITESFKLIRKE